MNSTTPPPTVGNVRSSGTLSFHSHDAKITLDSDVEPQVFPRSALSDLASWKHRKTRMPLVIRGARQTGKSFLVRMFARENFESLVEVDLDLDPGAADLFESRDPARIVPLLEAHKRAPIAPGRTLLFLDEIQAAPSVLASLRYFREKAPDLHVVCAGSLLDFAVEDPEYSVPVGRVEYLHLGPVRFHEFLLAAGEERLGALLSSWHPGDKVPAVLHARWMELLGTYLAVGGMPAAIAAWLDSRSLHEADRVKQSIVATFRDDFAKYARRAQVGRIRKVFDAIPALVGQRFKFSHVDREERAKDLGAALRLLCMARVAHRVRHTAANGVPLAAEADESRFKVLFLDVGLQSAALGLSLADLARARDLTTVNSGAVAEQFIGQHLLFSEEPFRTPELHFWVREARNSAAEVDYVLAEGPRVIPVEVKAGSTGTLKSLHAFVSEKRSPLAVRFNSDMPSLMEAGTTLSSLPRRRFRLLSLPLYMVGEVRRLCRELAVAEDPEPEHR